MSLIPLPPRPSTVADALRSLGAPALIKLVADSMVEEAFRKGQRFRQYSPEDLRAVVAASLVVYEDERSRQKPTAPGGCCQ